MNLSNVTENVKRAMAKAMLDEALKIIDSDEGKTLAPEELAARIKQFAAEIPEEKVEKLLADDAAGQEIKERFWRPGKLSCLNGTLLLRNTVDSDREGFLRLQQEYSPLRSLLEEEQYCSKIWDDHCGHTALTLSIIRDGAYVGYCGIKDLSKKRWEIAIELLPEWTRQGFGSAVLPAMLDAIRDRLGVDDFRVRIDPSNTASQALFEKLGARPNGISKFILHDEEEIRRCEEENLHQINDTLVAVARKFGVEPRRLLSHVLEYTLCWD